MNKITKGLLAGASVLALAVGLVACTGSSDPTDRNVQAQQSEQQFSDRTPPDVTGQTEYDNYMRAQEDIYDDPSTIIWCTVFPASATSPIFTVPIQGKLTSSSVSYFPNRSQRFSSGGSFTWSEENQSVDGMYHGSPPPYRYGFTPSGQYVDFTDLPTFCTTQLTEFQRETVVIEEFSE